MKADGLLEKLLKDLDHHYVGTVIGNGYIPYDDEAKGRKTYIIKNGNSLVNCSAATSAALEGPAR